MRLYLILIKVALKSIMKKRMRSFLTMLGIIIGVASVIIMVAIGQGAQAKIESEITSFGTNLLMIFPGERRRDGVSQGAGSFNRLTTDDVDLLQENATLITHISPMVNAHAQVIGGSNNWSTTITGCSPDYQTIRDYTVTEGVFFSDREIRAKAAVAVIGTVVAENLFPGESPIGKRIRIRNVPFTVIGLLASKGSSAGGGDQDDIILAPHTTVLLRLSGGRYINGIFASAVSHDDIDAAQEEITQLMRQAHKLEEKDDNDFEIHSQTEITDLVSSTTQILTLLLGSIAGISLVVGGIGIMNIMLVSVTERTKEIGIRLAVGARASDVLVQFLVEAVVLSLIGGMVGIISGFGIAAVINHFIGLETIVNPMVVFIAFTFAGAVGVFFGFYPARNAARLNPIEALRYE